MPAIPKPARGTAAAEKRTRRLALERRDRAENAKVKARSGGRCEVIVLPTPEPGSLHIYIGGGQIHRCHRRGLQTHHLLGGNGVRGRRESALAKNKIYTCLQCHTDIHDARLVPVGPVGAYWRRVR